MEEWNDADLIVVGGTAALAMIQKWELYFKEVRHD
jgi:hypothetical protein